MVLAVLVVQSDVLVEVARVAKGPEAVTTLQRLETCADKRRELFRELDECVVDSYTPVCVLM